MCLYAVRDFGYLLAKVRVFARMWILKEELELPSNGVKVKMHTSTACSFSNKGRAGITL